MNRSPATRNINNINYLKFAADRFLDSNSICNDSVTTNRPITAIAHYVCTENLIRADHVMELPKLAE
jgi:hypothetical protein